jgi:hypothetical protein
MARNKSKTKDSKGNHLKKDVSMLALLANSNTHNCRLLLKKLGKEDAKNHLDLELKLAEIYKAAPDKIVIEKQFAEIHPHKDFILKHLAPAPVEIDKTKIEVVNPDIIEQDITNSKDFVSEQFHGCCGTSSASGHSCSCGCNSNFSGITGESETKSSKIDITIIGLVAVVALFGMVLIAKK